MCSLVSMQSVDILKYTDDEYENHLTDPVSFCFLLSFYFMYEIKTCPAYVATVYTCFGWRLTCLIGLQLAGLDQGRDRSVVWILWKVWSPLHSYSWSVSSIPDCRRIEGSLLQWYVDLSLFYICSIFFYFVLLQGSLLGLRILIRTFFSSNSGLAAC